MVLELPGACQGVVGHAGTLTTSQMPPRGMIYDTDNHNIFGFEGAFPSRPSREQSVNIFLANWPAEWQCRRYEDSSPIATLKDRPMKVAGLFAGMGGFELGLGAAGHEAVMLCEIWDPARAVLAARFPDIPCRPDITGLRSLPADAELLVAGFPCQDLSQAGLTAGIGGRRSGLVEHIFRLLDRRRVPWVVLENVSFMRHLGKRQGTGYTRSRV